jgi:hypothetical protein
MADAQRSKDDGVIDVLIEMAQRHGEQGGTEYEVNDLQELCRAMWRLLTPEQVTAFMATEAVTFLNDNFSDDECEHPNSVGSDDEPLTVRYCPDCGRSFIVDRT